MTPSQLHTVAVDSLPAAPVRLTRRGRILRDMILGALILSVPLFGIRPLCALILSVRDALDALVPYAPVLVPLLVSGPAWLALVYIGRTNR